MISYEADRFGDTNYIEYSVQTDFNFPMHLHRCLEFMLVTEGEMEVEVNTRRYLASKGQGVLFLPNEAHSFYSPAHSKMISLVFSPDLIPSFTKQVEGKSSNTPCFQVDELLSEYLIPRFSSKKDVDVLEAKGIFYMICASFLQQVTFNKTDKKNIILLNRILSYIQEHFTENLTLNILSKELGHDYYYLSHYFSDTLHITFKGYLTQYRISYAATLLEQTDFNITDIVYRCGYSSIRAFNYAFQKIMGTAPSDFRRQLRKLNGTCYKTFFREM